MLKPSFLEEMTRKTRRIEFDDGLFDIQNAIVFLMLGLIGGFFLSNAGMEWYVRSLIENRTLTLVGLFGLMALFIAVGFGSRRLILRIRNKVLRPGRGSFVPLTWQVDRRITAAAVLVFLLIFVGSFLLIPNATLDMAFGMRVSVAAAGLATAVIYFAMGLRLAVNRYRWVGLAGAAGSLLLFWLPLSSAVSWLAFGVYWAMILALSGGLALRKVLAEKGE